MLDGDSTHLIKLPKQAEWKCLSTGLLVNVTYALCALVYKNLSNLDIGTSALNLCSFFKSAAIWTKPHPSYIFLCEVCAHRRMCPALADENRGRALQSTGTPWGCAATHRVTRAGAFDNTEHLPWCLFSFSANPPPTQQGKELHRLSQMSRYQPYSRII